MVVMSLSFTPITLVLTICSSICSGLTLFLTLRKKWIQRKNKPSAEFKSAFAQGLTAARDPTQAPKGVDIPLNDLSKPAQESILDAPTDKDKDLEWDTSTDPLTIKSAPVSTKEEAKAEIHPPPKSDAKIHQTPLDKKPVKTAKK
jgi:hypothetical protein